tara:strand:- start:2305 stop:2571 length:267 start_codon:yes stop_codon:yes gene_type:complete
MNLEQQIEKLKKKIEVKNKLLMELRGSRYAIKLSRDKLKAKHENKLRAIIKLKLDGLLDLTDEQIANRFFVEHRHIVNLTYLVKESLK